MKTKKFGPALLAAVLLSGVLMSAYAQSDKHRATVQEMLTLNSTTGSFLAGLSYGMAGGDKATPASKKRAACAIKGLDRKLLEKKLIDAYMAYFSTAQAADVIDFYNTPTGKKLIGFAADVASGKLSPDPNVQPAGLTEADVAAFTKFAQQTSGGRRMQEVSDKPVNDVGMALKPEITKLFEKCGGKH